MIRWLPPGVPGGGITGVVPMSGGSMVLFGVMPLGGGMTPSQRSRRSDRLPPGHMEPVDRGSCGDDRSGGVSGETGVWAAAADRPAAAQTTPAINGRTTLLIILSPVQPASSGEEDLWEHRAVPAAPGSPRRFRTECLCHEPELASFPSPSTPADRWQ